MSGDSDRDSEKRRNFLATLGKLKWSFGHFSSHFLFPWSLTLQDKDLFSSHLLFIKGIITQQSEKEPSFLYYGNEMVIFERATVHKIFGICFLLTLPAFGLIPHHSFISSLLAKQ